MTVEDKLLAACEELVDAAQPLRGCNVRAYATHGTGIMVCLMDGDHVDWRHFWEVLEKAVRARRAAAAPVLRTRTPTKRKRKAGQCSGMRKRLKLR